MQEGNREHRNESYSKAAFFEIARQLVHHKSFDSYPVVHEDEKRMVRRLFAGDDSYSQIPGVVFSFDFDVKKNKQPDVHSAKLIFEYVIPSSGEAKQKNIAQMHFEEHPNHEFRLFHRYVAPDLRKDGIGTRLFHLTEEWFLKIAQELHAPVMLSLQTGQKSVIAWVEKMGFSVAEDDQALRREIDEHPERFFEDEVVVSEESQAQGIIKDRYIFRVGTVERYMDNGAIRLTFKKRIVPDMEDSSVDVEAPSE